MNNRRETVENEVFETIEKINNLFSKNDIEEILEACQNKLKSFKKQDTVSWMKELFNDEKELTAIRWKIYAPDADLGRKKWVGYADVYCPHLDSKEKEYETESNWETMDEFATETPGKPWFNIIKEKEKFSYQQEKYCIVYERDFIDFQDFKII